MLGSLEGKTVLDAYAGSGALSFEAVSRGAKHVVALDIDKKAYRTLVENIESLNLEEAVKATRANCITWAKNNALVEFDVVFVDPPYYDLNPLHIDELSKRVVTGGLLVISHGEFYRPAYSEQGWQLLTQKKYAQAHISIFEKSAIKQKTYG